MRYKCAIVISVVILACSAALPKTNHKRVKFLLRSAVARDLNRPLPKPGMVWSVGLGSFYGRAESGHATASGEIYRPWLLTAAERTLPFGTVVRVTDLKTHRSVVVRINDRGPFWPNRIIDLSVAAAHRIGLHSGLAPMRVLILKVPHRRASGWTVQVGPLRRYSVPSVQKFLLHDLGRCRRSFGRPRAARSASGWWVWRGGRVWIDRQRASDAVLALLRSGYNAYLVRVN